MKIGMNQPYLFPYIGYFQLINAVDKFVIADDVQYIKGGWINGNRTLCGGVERIISLPVKRDSQYLNINQRHFAEPFEAGRREFLNKLRNDYRKAPYFNAVMALLEKVMSHDDHSVTGFVTNQLQVVCDYLDIRTPFLFSSAVDTRDDGLKGQDWVIRTNKALGAAHYINPIGGMEIYSPEVFEKNGLKLSFLRTRGVHYKQFDHLFVPDLSIIDVLMFNSQAETRELLQQYDLVSMSGETGRAPAVPVKDKFQISLPANATTQELVQFFQEIDGDYVPPISSKVHLVEYTEKLKAKAILCIARRPGDNRIIGLIAFYCNDSDKGDAYISVVGVSSSARGEGVGQGSFDKVVDYIRQQGFASVSLQTWEGNRIESFYEARGFKVYDRVPDRPGNLHSLKMRKYFREGKEPGEGGERSAVQSKERKLNCLVTAIGSFSGEAAISSLKNKLGARVIGCDIYAKDWLPVASTVDVFYQIPIAYEREDYLEALQGIIQKEGVDFVIPLTDPEVDLLSENRERIEGHNVRICMPDQGAVSLCRNKLKLYEFFRENALVNVIPTFLASGFTSDMCPLPIMAKPLNGRSSEGIYVVREESELKIFMDRPGYIFQPWLQGDIFTVDLVRDVKHRKCTSMARKELIRSINGAGLTVEMAPRRDLLEMACHIGERIGINGCINMEFIHSDGKFYLMDINPRFSAGVAFSALAGYDMVANHLQCFMGGEIEGPVSYKKMIMAKKLTDVITRIDN